MNYKERPGCRRHVERYLAEGNSLEQIAKGCVPQAGSEAATHLSDGIVMQAKKMLAEREQGEG